MTIEIEDRAREILARATDGVTVSPELERRVRALTSTPPRRTRRVLAPLATAAAVLAAVVVWSAVDGREGDDVTSVPPDPVTTPSFPTDRWTALPSAPTPLSSRAAVGVPGGVALWELAGAEGGSEDQRLRLWQLDLATREWDAVGLDGAPPEGPTSTWDVGEAVWTGGEMVAVVRDTTANVRRLHPLDVIRWRPGHDALERGTPPTLPADLAGGGWSAYAVRLAPSGGAVAAVVTFGDGAGAVRHLAWSYDLTEDSWSRLPDLPTSSDRLFSLAWTGEDLLVLAGRPTPVATLYDGLDLFRLRPGAAAWEAAARPPSGLHLSGQSATGVWDGGRLVVVSYEPSAAAWDPVGDSWSALSVPPIGSAEDYPAGLVTGTGAVVTGYWRGFAVLPRGAGEWRALPEADVRAVVVTGDAVVGLGDALRAGESRVPENPVGRLQVLGT